jgi:hypothetical protein
MGFLSRFKPSRSGEWNFKTVPPPGAKDFELIADIDALITKPVCFKLFGKRHEVSPMDMDHFFSWTEKLAAMWALNKKENAKPEELYQVYFDLINSVCPTITMADIKKCTGAQIAAISGLLFDHATGKAHTEDWQKKKRMMMEKVREQTPPKKSAI